MVPVYSPRKKDFGEAAQYRGSAPTGVFTFCDSPSPHGITSYRRQLAACDDAVGSSKYYTPEGLSLWTQTTEVQSIASDTGSNGVVSSRCSASISSSTITQLCGPAHDLLETTPLEVQDPWSPDAPAMPKPFHRPQKSGARLSSASDVSNETTSYFSCASSITSSSTQQFHECSEWYQCGLDDHVLLEDLEPEVATPAGVQSDAPVCDSDLFQPINELLESFESFGSLSSSLKFQSPNHMDAQSAPRSNEQETSQGSEFSCRNSSVAVDPFARSERRAGRPAGQSFGTVRMTEFDSSPDSVSDLMTSSEDGNEEEGNDMSYNAWMTKTADDLSIGSGESPEDILNPLNAEQVELRLPTKVQSTSVDDVQAQSSPTPDFSQRSGHTSPEPAKAGSIAKIQVTKSIASEDSLGLMERVVGMTLHSLKCHGSWTDISTLHSEKSDIESYAPTRLSSDVADWSESPLSWEFAEEAQLFQAHTFKALTYTHVNDQSMTGGAESAAVTVAEGREEASCSRSKDNKEENGSTTVESISRDPSLTYMAQSNPTFRNRLSLEVTSSNERSLSQDQIEDLQRVFDNGQVQDSANLCRITVQKGFKAPHLAGSLQTNELSRVGAVRLTADVLKEFEWRLPLRNFTALSEPPGLNFLQSAKYRILTWFGRIFASTSALPKKENKSDRRSYSMAHGCMFDLSQDINLTAQAINTTPSENSNLSEAGDCECETPAPSVIDEDFGFPDAEDLNKKIRSLPELQGINMGHWTSKMIGFATPAKYYAHMARELHEGGISVFAILSRQLGLEHSLVQELKAELEEDGKELIVALNSVPVQRRLVDEEWNYKEKANEWGTSVLSALLQCGINALFFDRGPVSFQSVSEYYSYLSQKLRTEGVDIDCIIPQLEQRLGVQHPLMDALDKCMELNGKHVQRKGEDLQKSNSNSNASFSTHETNYQEPPGSHEELKERKRPRARLANFVRFMKGSKHTRTRSADTNFQTKGFDGDDWDPLVVENQPTQIQNDDPPARPKCHSFGLKGIGERLRNRKAMKKNTRSHSRGQSLAIEPTRVRNAMEMDREEEEFKRGCVSMDPGSYGPTRQSSAHYVMADQAKCNVPDTTGRDGEQRAHMNVSLDAYPAPHESSRAIRTHQRSRSKCRLGEKPKGRKLFMSNMETCPL